MLQRRYGDIHGGRGIRGKASPKEHGFGGGGGIDPEGPNYGAPLTPKRHILPHSA